VGGEGGDPSGCESENTTTRIIEFTKNTVLNGSNSRGIKRKDRFLEIQDGLVEW